MYYYPLRLDSALYIEVVFNQIAPDYLIGFLLVTPGEHLDQQVVVSFPTLKSRAKSASAVNG